jgi:hypothetical protein
VISKTPVIDVIERRNQNVLRTGVLALRFLRRGEKTLDEINFISE